MEVIMGVASIARGRPKRSQRRDVSVKIDEEVVQKAKHVALTKRITLAEYLTELLRGPVEKDFAKAVKLLTSREEQD